MDYGLNEVVNMIKVYHDLEYEAKLFLSITAFAMKRKDAEIKSAKKTLLAIGKYK